MHVSQSRTKRAILVIGILIAALLLAHNSTFAQEKKAEYVCTPCGCSEDNTIVHNPGNCGTCGMKLINLHNPNEGINYKNITAAQLCTILANNPDVIILDVRSPAEYTAENSLGRFKNAINFPINQSRDNLERLEKYKDKEIVVYCSISARSPRVSELLANNGFDHVHNLMGGLNNWRNQAITDLPCKESATLK